jgi:RNA polymerase sigma-70 factor (ECF subfamily)
LSARRKSPGRSEAEEAALLERLRAGEADAFEEVVRENTPRMLVVARRMLRQEQDAEEVVQEAFLSAFRAMDRFAGGSRISTWLHRITVNAALMRLRSRRRRPETPIEELLPHFLEDGHHAEPPAAWRWSGEDLLQRKEAREAVRAGIEKLPENYRNVLILRDIEELDTAEVAELLDITTGAVKTRLHRARQALHELIDPVLREERS